MIIIDTRGTTPIYTQIKNQIKELIILGILTPHSKISSIRTMARDLSINFNTVKKSYAELESEGVIYSVVGKGTFIAENAMGNNLIHLRASKELKVAIESAMSNGLTKDDIYKIVDKGFINFGKERTKSG